ncbi:MAG TPA: hypothetical protein PK530_10060 [Anaerolineales bacterium]|nr:hypothetical protein [Anaerolineales bacterium]
MVHKYIHKHIILFMLLSLGLLMAGCNQLPIPGNATETPTLLPPTETPTPTPTDAPTPTPLPPLVVLLSPPEADPNLSAALEPQFTQLAREAGFRFQIRQTLSPEETAAEVDYLIVLPPAPGLEAIIATARDTRILTVGVPNLVQAPNLIAVGTEVSSPANNAFLAGYIAALITPEYRAGAIGLQDSPTAETTPLAFYNGMHFFCGLCRYAVPPFYEYPFYVNLPSTASDIEWRALVDFMRDRAVQTVYFEPGVGGAGVEDLYRYAAEQGLYIIGEVKPPEDILDNWLVSMRPPDLEGTYLQYWPQLLNGEMGVVIPMPAQLSDIQTDLLTPGKQRLVLETMADLEAGLIDPLGVVEAP